MNIQSTAILTKEPQELLDHLNRHTRTALEKIDPIGRDGKFTFSRVEVDLGRVRLAEARSTSVNMQGHAFSLMTVIVSEQGQSVLKRKAGGEVVSSKGDAAILSAHERQRSSRRSTRSKISVLAKPITPSRMIPA